MKSKLPASTVEITFDHPFYNCTNKYLIVVGLLLTNLITKFLIEMFANMNLWGYYLSSTKKWKKISKYKSKAGRIVRNNKNRKEKQKTSEDGIPYEDVSSSESNGLLKI